MLCRPWRTQIHNTEDHLQSFFFECLNFPHWEQHKTELSNSIRELIEVICLHYDELFDFENLEWPTETQVIEVEQLPQWVDILNSHLTTQYRSGEKFRLLHDESLQKMLNPP